MTRRRTALWPVMAATLIAVGTALALAMGTGDRQGAAPPLPTVQPMALMPIAEDAARAANAEQPFISTGFPAAAPYRFTGDSAAAARATDCLTAALLYEAGDDADGQRPVAQVILNRARHPAFPSSICGVVFQGSERRTGCQFTFTCDGSLRRRYSADAWTRARGIAIAALNGDVDPRVGLATHYHTDWVRPYWSSSLDKLAQVGTHLFFRWQGYWGTPGAFRGRGSDSEPLIGRMAALSPAHAAAPDAALALSPSAPANIDLSAEDVEAITAVAVRDVIPKGERALGDTIILTLDPFLPERFPVIAAAACGARSYCKVMGWTDPARGPDTAIITDEARAAMSFSYLRDQSRNLERSLWNCREFPRAAAGQCMRR
jgi:spore germination cell wall hydrolase CwlJ-like protein